MSNESTLEIHPRARPGDGSAAAGSLPTALLLRALSDARANGLCRVCFAGEEPLLHPGLPALLERAHTLGMSRALRTYCADLDERRCSGLAGLDFVWVVVECSGDGARPRGYSGWDSEYLAERLSRLAVGGIPFGLSTRSTCDLSALIGVAQMALAAGASALRLTTEPCVNLRARPDAMIAALRLVSWAGRQRLPGALRVELDGIDSERLTRSGQPLQVEPLPSPDEVADVPLGEVLDRLVLRGDAMLTPLRSSEVPLGDLREDSLDNLAARWRIDQYERLRRRYCRVLGRVMRWEEALRLEEFRELVLGFEGFRDRAEAR